MEEKLTYDVLFEKYCDSEVEIVDLLSENTKLKEKVKNQKNMLTTLQKRNETLTKNLRQIQTELPFSDIEDDMIDELREENIRLYNELSKEKATVDNLNEKIMELTTEKANSISEHADAFAKFLRQQDEDTSKIEELNICIDVLIDRYANAKKLIERLEDADD
jgi:chromosome segregation ATPase